MLIHGILLGTGGPSPPAACDRIHAAGLGRWDPGQNKSWSDYSFLARIPIADKGRNVVVEVRLTLCAGNPPPVNCRRGPAAGASKDLQVAARRGTERAASDSNDRWKTVIHPALGLLVKDVGAARAGATSQIASGGPLG